MGPNNPDKPTPPPLESSPFPPASGMGQSRMGDATRITTPSLDGVRGKVTSFLSGLRSGNNGQPPAPEAPVLENPAPTVAPAMENPAPYQGSGHPSIDADEPGSAFPPPVESIGPAPKSRADEVIDAWRDVAKATTPPIPTPEVTPPVPGPAVYEPTPTPTETPSPTLTPEPSPMPSVTPEPTPNPTPQPTQVENVTQQPEIPKPEAKGGIQTRELNPNEAAIAYQQIMLRNAELINGSGIPAPIGEIFAQVTLPDGKTYFKAKMPDGTIRLHFGEPIQVKQPQPQA